MHITFRRLLFAFFVLIFLVSAPLVVLHTAGYRLNISNKRLQQTGVLAITTYPRGSSIGLNGQALTYKTPYVFQRMMPNHYEVSLQKPGYHAWSQKVEVAAGKTSYIDARIFADSKPVTLNATGSALALRYRRTPPDSTATDAASINFISNGASIEVHVGKQEHSEPIALLPLGTYELLQETSEHILIRDEQQRAFILDRNGQQVVSFPTRLSAFDWLTNEGLILWTDGAEVHIFEVETSQNSFITREGEAVADVAWHPSADSFFVVSGTNLLAYDRSIHETREVVRLMSELKTSDIWLDANGKNLFYLDHDQADSLTKTLLVNQLVLTL